VTDGVHESKLTKTPEPPEIPETTELPETTEALDTDTETRLDDSATEASGEDVTDTGDAAYAPDAEDYDKAADSNDAVADDEVANDAVPEDSVADEEATDTPAGRRRRDMFRVLRRIKLVPLILTLLLVICGGVTVWLYYVLYRPDQRVSPRIARTAVTAASEGTVALLSYSSDTLDQDFANARSHLGGDFLSYYETFSQQSVAPAAKEKSTKTTARVKRAGISELHPNSAVVLLFVDQSTTSKDSPDPKFANSSVLVTMTRVEGKWLITKFNPF
jgi:Mce-associated membrane protein